MSQHYCYRLQQLARLGLPSQVFIPAFLQELHYDINSISHSYCWQNAHGQVTNLFDEKLNLRVINDFSTAISHFKSQKYAKAIALVSQLDEPATTFEFCDKSIDATVFHQEVLLPMGYFNSCFVPIIASESKIRLGILIVHRKQEQSDFSLAERSLLKRTASIINYGLSHPVLKDLYSTDGWEQGLFITNIQGELQYICPSAEKLISLASSSHFAVHSNYAEHNLIGHLNLKRLIDSVINQDVVSAHNNNPTITISNAWGKFILHAFLMSNHLETKAQQIGFHIRWQEPFVLKLFHRIKTLELTPRQETVALFYVAGLPLQTIADELTISIYTVKDHIKNICDRLNIKTRAELTALILCATIT